VAFVRTGAEQPVSFLVRSVSCSSPDRATRTDESKERSTNLSQRANGSLGTAQGKIADGLQVQPELRRGGEGLAKEPRRLRRDPPLPAHKLIDPLDRYTNVGSELNLADAQGGQKLIEKNLAWVGGGAVGWNHGAPGFQLSIINGNP